MAWTFSGAFLDGTTAGRVTVGAGEPRELPGRYALAGLVDAHAHPTVAADEHGPYLADGEYGAARLDEYAASGVTVIRDAGGRSQVTLGFGRAAAGSLARDFLGIHPAGDIVTYDDDPREDPGVLASPSAVV